MNEVIKDLKKVLSSDNVLEKLEERYAYAQDASNTFVSLPDVVVFAQTIKQVQQIVQIANKYSIPIICRGAGTNTVGACVAESVDR